MTDDIKAIRDALAADGLTHGEWVACGPSFGDPLPRFLSEVVRPDDADGGEVIASAPAGGEYSADMAYIAACHPERIARLLDALEADRQDAEAFRAISGGSVQIRFTRSTVKIGDDGPVYLNTLRKHCNGIARYVSERVSAMKEPT